MEVTHNQNCTINKNIEWVFFPPLYSCIICVGLPSNCLAMYGLYRLIKSDYTLPVYIINLLLSDLLHIATLPIWIDFALNKNKWYLGSTACWLVSCIFYITMFSSIFFMCFISLERYLAIVYPLWFQRHRKLRNSILACLALWVLIIFTVSWSVYIGFSVRGNHCLKTIPTPRGFAILQLIVIPLTFLVPLAFLLFCFFRVRQVLASNSFISPQEKRKIYGLLLLIIIIFTTVFGPYHVVSYAVYAGTLVVADSCGYEGRLFHLLQISVGILSLNVLLDPVMYIFLRTDFREILDSGCWGQEQVNRLRNWGRRPRRSDRGRETVHTVSEAVSQRDAV
uniref:G-protein coupled receptor 4-like n=1 Tax=Lepisosteus oculatus TaxID=7918 RepID=W5NMA3_LEPOC|nr:PREDICTED: G-protein coupled receptor 4-like [Lepisosteus oculatus]